NRRHFRPRGEIVTAGIAPQDEQRMSPADTAVRGIVECGVEHSATLQFLNSLLGSCLQLADLSKLDRLRGTGLGACRNQSCLLPVVTESALERAPIVVV